MATRYLARSLLTSLTLVSSRHYASTVHSASSFLCRLRPLMVAASSHFRPGISGRAFSTRLTNSSLNYQNPNRSNCPPEETSPPDGCDFEHWLVVMDPPGDGATRDEIIDGYIKTLASVLGSEEEARKKIYSVSTRHYFAFGALVSEELSYKIKELPTVSWVLPDSYSDAKNKDYGGEPFINGQAVPYDPKYHEEWVRNDAGKRDRNRDRPRRYFDERVGGVQGRNSVPNAGGPGCHHGGQPNMGPPPVNAPNVRPRQPHKRGPSNYRGGAPPHNPGNYPAGNNMRGPAYNAPDHQCGPGPNSGGEPFQPGPGPNWGGAPFQPGPGPNSGGAPFNMDLAQTGEDHPFNLDLAQTGEDHPFNLDLAQTVEEHLFNMDMAQTVEEHFFNMDLA